MTPITRREFVRNTTLAAAVAPLAASMRAAETVPPPLVAPRDPAALRWLEDGTPPAIPGTSWGMPWPRGLHPRETKFALRTAGGEPVPVQSRPLAFWPDGSLKWTAHAIPADAPIVDAYRIAPGTPATPARPVVATETADEIEIDTGVIRVKIGRTGTALIRSVTRGGLEIARDGRLVCRLENRTDPGAVRIESFTGEIAQVTLEQAGPVRAVVKLEGRHAGGGGRGCRLWCGSIFTRAATGFG